MSATRCRCAGRRSSVRARYRRLPRNVRYWWNRFGPLFAGEIRRRRADRRNWSNWRWHLDEVFVRINGEPHYLWRAVDHEGEVLEVFATKRRDRGRCAQVPEACHETLWPAGLDRHGPASVIPGGVEGDRQRGLSEDRALAQQPGRNLTSTLSATRTRNGKVQE